MKNSSVTCKILAWRDLESSVKNIVIDKYYEIYQCELNLLFTTYFGGGEFISIFDSDNSYDIIITDRELLYLLYYQGYLKPISEGKQHNIEALKEFPDWIKPYIIRDSNALYSLPIRWGSTLLLINRDLYNIIDRADIKDRIIKEASSYLIWNPSDYWLYSTCVLSSIINDGNPFMLNDAKMSKLKNTFDVLSNKECTLEDNILKFKNLMINSDYDIILTSGDWIFKLLTGPDLCNFAKIKNKYCYPVSPRFKPITFFESLSISNKSLNYDVAKRVITILSCSEIRVKLSKWNEHSDTQGYFISNGFKNDTKVYGDNFTLIPVNKFLKETVPRIIPYDDMLRPVYESCRYHYKQFADIAKKK